MGGQKAIYLFLKHFSRYCNVICYTTKNNIPGANEPFQIKKVLGNHRLRYINPIYFYKLKKDFKRENITHLLLEQPFYGWLGILIKKKAGVKLIIHSHNIEALRFRSISKWWWPILEWYERLVHRKADFNFFITAEDRQYAIQKFGLEQEKCAILTYGTEKKEAPSPEEKTKAKKEIFQQYGIDNSNYLILYNGTLNYLPNKKGLDYILEQINPMLVQEQSFSYTIMICGSGLAPEYQNLKHHTNIIYAGFVDDIDTYLKATDIFINPVTDGGGIKTKLVEALAAGCSAVSFTNGAIGVPASITGNKLKVVPDNDVSAFTKSIFDSVKSIQDITPADFFNHFNWDKIAKETAEIIKANT